MAFTPIDEQTWERREYLEVFRQTAIYLTAEVDITPLYRHTKARGEKLYPALIWCAAAVLNRHVHFRYGRDEAGRIGIWDVLHPYYTVPRRDAPDLFAMKVTRFMPDYDVFRPDVVSFGCQGHFIGEGISGYLHACAYLVQRLRIDGSGHTHLVM